MVFLPKNRGGTDRFQNSKSLNLKGATAAAADPLKRAKIYFLAIFYNFRNFWKIGLKSVFGGPWGSLGPRGPIGNHGEPWGAIKIQKIKFWLRSSVRDFFRNFLLKCWGSCGLLGEVRWPWEALGAIFVEQRFGPSPPKGQGVHRSSPQEGRLFGHPGDKKKSENVGPLVGSLARPGGPGKLWRQSLLNKDLA